MKNFFVFLTGALIITLSNAQAGTMAKGSGLLFCQDYGCLLVHPAATDSWGALFIPANETVAEYIQTLQDKATKSGKTIGLRCKDIKAYKVTGQGENKLIVYSLADCKEDKNIVWGRDDGTGPMNPPSNLQ